MTSQLSPRLGPVTAILSFMLLAGVLISLLAVPYLLGSPDTSPQRPGPLQHWAPITLASKKAMKLRCIQVIHSLLAREGIGEQLRRNQLAVFFAAVYGVPMQWPAIRSTHGYVVRELFTPHCAPPANKACTLRQASFLLMRCRRGDCLCALRYARHFIGDMVERCEAVAIENDGLRTMEYSGCLREPLTMYFAYRGDPCIEYDLIHYRQGDVHGKNTTKTQSVQQLYAILRAMCQLSSRPIVMLTEGRPAVPRVSCFHRIVLANDTSLMDAFSLVRHARVLSLAGSTFAFALAEVSSPERFIVPQAFVPHYEWMAIEAWTVINDHNIAFNFEEKQLMLEAMVQRPSSERSLRIMATDVYKFSLSVPLKMYNASEYWCAHPPTRFDREAVQVGPEQDSRADKQDT